MALRDVAILLACLSMLYLAARRLGPAGGIAFGASWIAIGRELGRAS